MGRFVTPSGVEIETSEEAARAVGYQPVEKPKKAPAKKAPARKKAETSDSDE